MKRYINIGLFIALSMLFAGDLAFAQFVTPVMGRANDYGDSGIILARHQSESGYISGDDIFRYETSEGAYSPGYYPDETFGTGLAETASPLPPYYSMDRNVSGTPFMNNGISGISADPIYYQPDTNHLMGKFTAPSMNSNPNIYKGMESQNRGLIRAAGVNGVWAPGTGSGQKKLQMLQTGASFTVAMPIPRTNNTAYLALSPTFSMFNFDWRHDTDLADNFYNLGLGITIGKRIGKQYEFRLGASPGWSSDFKTGSDKAFKCSVFAMVTWKANARTDFTLGAIYLDRSDIPVMPLVGMVWRPVEDVCFELMLPRPRLAQRVRWWGSMTGDRVSDWIYIGGEFAGGSWAVEKDSPNGKTTRKLEYYDYRALVGFERKVLDFATFSCEVGYIFGRKFSTPDFDRDYKPDGTPFVQLKIVY